MPVRGTISILLIEHAAGNLNWVEEHLLGLDVDLFWASSAVDAMELARENDFSMAMLAVNRPEDGIETARLVLSHSATRNLPIILICFGSRDCCMPITGIGAGIVDILSIPVDPLILQNRIQLFRDLFHQRKSIEQHLSEVDQTHHQLKMSNERYLRLLESVTSYVYTVAIAEGEAISTVHGLGCEVVTGFAADEYVADQDLWIRMIPEEDRPAVLDAARRVLRETSPQSVEHRIHHKDGYIHWVRNTLVPHFDLEGTLVSYDGIIIDITERKQSERKLAKSFSLLEATLESTADGILVVDDNGFITSYNKNFLSLWRIPDSLAAKRNDDELIAFVLSQLKHPEQFIEKIRYLYSHPEYESFDLLEFIDGRIFERYSKPQIMGYEIVGRVWSFRDISERRQLEEQLRQAQKMEAVGQMAGGIAHDFNNILTVILGYGSQLQENFKEDDPLRESIDQVLAAADRAANLTRSLLVFSRKQVMTPQTVDLNEIVSNMEKFLKRIIGEDVQLKISYYLERLSIYADSGQLEQVVMNLAANARDAMPDGGMLTIETQVRELDADFFQAHGPGESRKYAILMISDSGCGMSREISARLFDPFFSTKEIGKGTGLGLSIVYGIIQQHGGHIMVSSQAGVGTTFTILIPLTNISGADVYQERLNNPSGGTETILVAEDDPAIRQMIAVELRCYGYEVIVAEDGQDAIEKFRANRERIHLALLDMLMPRKRGWEVYEEIRDLSPAIKTLFMSGYSPDLLNIRGLCNNGSEILMKPFRPLDLARKVRALLDTR